jgi:RNA recognition motif-containing protein
VSKPPSSRNSVDLKRNPDEEMSIAQNKKDNAGPLTSEPVAKRQRTSPTSSDKKPETGCDDGPKLGENSSEVRKGPTASSRPLAPVLKNSTLYIGNLHPKVAKIHLEKLMEKFGTIERLHTKVTSTSSFAFCEMKTIEEAQKAMASLDGITLLGKRLVVKPSHDSNQGPVSSQQSGDTKSKPNARTLQNQRQQLDAKIAQLKRKIGDTQAHS